MSTQIFSNLIPVIAFALFFSLTFVGFTIWKKWLSPHSKIIKQRIQEIKGTSLRGSLDLLIHKDLDNSKPWLTTLKKKLPFSESLKLIIIRAGINKTLDDILLLIIAVVLSGIIILSLTPLPIWVAIIGGLAFGLTPIFYLQHKGSKRRWLFEKQLPEALGFLARSLKAGHGLTIAMSMLADDAPQPLGKEFKIVVDQINFGLPFGEALQNLSVRVNSPDLDFFISSLLIQRETGSNLAELLITLGETIRDRMKLVGKVRALSAEGKISGVFLSLMPFIMGLLLSLINPEYMSTLWTTEVGNILIGSGLVMMLLGSIWIAKIIKIKV